MTYLLQNDSSRPAIRSNRTILFLAQLPPPLHGASTISKRAYETLSARADIELTHLWRGGAATQNDVGQRSLAKLLAFAALLVDLSWRFAKGQRFDIGYMTFAPWSHAALRDALLIAMSKLLARRTLVHLHGIGLEPILDGQSLMTRLLRYLIRGAELIAITEKSAIALAKTGHFSAVHTLPNCIANHSARPLLANPSIRCGYLANLDPRKGALRFLDCVAALVRADIPVKARLAGPTTPALPADVLAHEIERRGLAGIIEVVGPVFGDEKAEFLSNVDMFIYLSRHDYAPLVLIEAMSCGAIPIVYDNQGEREIVGDAFEANVVAPDQLTAAMQHDVTRIVRHYHEDRQLLMRDRNAAVERYLHSFTEEYFRARLIAIVDGEALKTPERSPTP